MTDATIWAEISCQVPAALVDCTAEFLVELSGGGVSIENLTVDTFSLETLEDSPVKTLKAYFPADADLAEKVSRIEAFLAATAPACPGFAVKPPEVHYIREEDWANNWKVHFKPTRIGTTLVIKPTWEEYEAQAQDLVIELDPGMAFGTGTHATTRLCLEAMERIFSLQAPFDRQVRPATVLDVGTGSGVLAIAAAKLGAGRVAGIDIDAGAVVVAEQNLIQNHVEDRVQVNTEPLEKVAETYDLVLANILAEDLVKMSAALVRKVGAGGSLILSGILTEKESLVSAGFQPYQLELIEVTRQAEWSCLVYCREV